MDGQKQEPAQEGLEPSGAEGDVQEPDYKALYEQALGERDELSKKYEDAKRHSRKWEGIAKKSDKTIDERVAALEQENADLKASAARARLVKDVAKSTGCPESAVAMLNGETEEALTEQAKALAESISPKSSGPTAPEAGVIDAPGKPTKESILSIKDAKKRKAAIAANIDLF